MADPRIIDLNLTSTMWHLGDAQYLMLFDVPIQYNHDTEKVVNVDAVAKSSQFFNGAGAPAFTANPDGTCTFISTQQWTVSVATGFTLRAVTVGSSFLPSNHQAYGNLTEGIEIFDNETIILRLRFVNKIAKTEAVRSTMTYNQAGDTVDVAILPWSRVRFGMDNSPVFGDGTVVPTADGMSKLDLDASIDWLFLNGNQNLRAINMTATANIRQNETLAVPIRIQDIVTTTGIVTNPTTIKWIKTGRYFVVLSKQITVPANQSFQMVINETVNCKDPWEFP